MQPAGPVAGQTVSHVHIKATQDAGHANGTPAASSMRMAVSRVRLAQEHLACGQFDLPGNGLRSRRIQYGGVDLEITNIHCASLHFIQ